MGVQVSRIWIAPLLTVLIAIPYVAVAAGEGQHGSHMSMTGVIVKKDNALAVKTPDGSTFQVNENAAKRKGQEPFKEGDKVTVVVDENNTVIDMHLEGEESKHKMVTGKLIHVGKMKDQIKLQTADGEKVFPLTKQEVKTKALPEGTKVTVELNEAGEVIDLHAAK